MLTKNDLIAEMGNLSTISPAIVELINIIDKPETTTSKVAQLVSYDKVLVLNVFKYLTSAAFALRRRPINIQEAVSFLGLQGLKNLIFIISANGIFSSQGFWYKSVFTAFCAQRIAQESSLDPKIISDVYIAGLMHNLGTLILRNCDQRKANLFEELDLQERLIAEEKYFGMNHIELSYEIAIKNNMPRRITSIIKRQQLNWDKEEFCCKNAIIELSRSIAEIDYVDEKEIRAALNKKMMQRFGLDAIKVNVQQVKGFHDMTEEFLAI